MTASAIELLTEHIYDSAVDPNAWTAVMQGLRSLFHTEAETLYFLNYQRRTKDYVHIHGIPAGYQRSFPEIFYRDDNPCIRSPQLHRPGVLRSDDILCQHFADPQALTRSAYYNDWMRPQGLRHSMGVTPLAESGRVLNLSLLRAAAAGPFRADELRRFGTLSRHLERALRIGLRLDGFSAGRGLGAAALDALRHGVLLLREDGRLLHANTAAERLLEHAAGLTLQAGRLHAAEPDAQSALDAMLRRLGTRAPAPDSVKLRIAGRRMVVSGLRLSGRRGRFLGGRPALMLLIVDPAAGLEGSATLMRRFYGFNPTEIRLAQSLLRGHGLRAAAEQVGVTYQTARWYLKLLFEKTGTSRQADLVAILLGDLAAVALDMF